jgi:hypothetical protein
MGMKMRLKIKAEDEDEEDIKSELCMQFEPELPSVRLPEPPTFALLWVGAAYIPKCIALFCNQ